MNFDVIKDQIVALLRRIEMTSEAELAAVPRMGPMTFVNFILAKLRDLEREDHAFGEMEEPFYMAIEGCFRTRSLLRSIDVQPDLVGDMISVASMRLCAFVRTGACESLNWAFLRQALRNASRLRGVRPMREEQLPDGFDERGARDDLNEALLELLMDKGARSGNTERLHAAIDDDDNSDPIAWDLVREQLETIADQLGYEAEWRERYVDMMLFPKNESGWQGRFAKHRKVADGTVSTWKTRFEADLTRHFGREVRISERE